MSTDDATVTTDNNGHAFGRWHRICSEGRLVYWSFPVSCTERYAAGRTYHGEWQWTLYTRPGPDGQWQPRYRSDAYDTEGGAKHAADRYRAIRSAR